MTVTKLHGLFLSRERFNVAGYKTSAALIIFGGLHFSPNCFT